VSLFFGHPVDPQRFRSSPRSRSHDLLESFNSLGGAMSNTQLLEKIDAAIAEKNLLKHPFYQDWQEGKLSRESLQLYAAQY
jgi:hypothetical protein